MDNRIIKEVYTDCAEQTEALGASLASLMIEEPLLPRFVALDGDLGAGKTAFTRGFASVFCPKARVKSPTFAIVNVYRGETVIHHLDTYRITDDDDLYSTGFYDMDEGFIICEWSENIEYALPAHRYEVAIEYADGEDKRNITLKEIN